MLTKTFGPKIAKTPPPAAARAATRLSPAAACGRERDAVLLQRQRDIQRAHTSREPSVNVAAGVGDRGGGGG